MTNFVSSSKTRTSSKIIFLVVTRVDPPVAAAGPPTRDPASPLPGPGPARALLLIDGRAAAGHHLQAASADQFKRLHSKRLQHAFRICSASPCAVCRRSAAPLKTAAGSGRAAATPRALAPPQAAARSGRQPTPFPSPPRHGRPLQRCRVPPRGPPCLATIRTRGDVNEHHTGALLLPGWSADSLHHPFGLPPWSTPAARAPSRTANSGEPPPLL
jgi:hypothetical protein